MKWRWYDYLYILFWKCNYNNIPIIHTQRLWRRKKAPCKHQFTIKRCTRSKTANTLITRFQLCSYRCLLIYDNCMIKCMIIVHLNAEMVSIVKWYISPIKYYFVLLSLSVWQHVCYKGCILSVLFLFQLLILSNWTNASQEQGVILHQILQHVALEAVGCVGCQSDQCSRWRGLRARLFWSAPL